MDERQLLDDIVNTGCYGLPGLYGVPCGRKILEAVCSKGKVKTTETLTTSIKELHGYMNTAYRRYTKKTLIIMSCIDDIIDGVRKPLLVCTDLNQKRPYLEFNIAIAKRYLYLLNLDVPRSSLLRDVCDSVFTEVA